MLQTPFVRQLLLIPWRDHSSLQALPTLQRRTIYFSVLFRKRNFTEESLFYQCLPQNQEHRAHQTWVTPHHSSRWNPSGLVLFAFPWQTGVAKMCTRHIYSSGMFSVFSQHHPFHIWFPLDGCLWPNWFISLEILELFQSSSLGTLISVKDTLIYEMELGIKIQKSFPK